MSAEVLRTGEKAESSSFCEQRAGIFYGVRCVDIDGSFESHEYMPRHPDSARIPVINHQIPGLVCKSEQGHCLKRQGKGMKQACLWYELIWKPIHSFFLIYGLNIHRQSGRMRFWQFPISATHIYLRVTREKSSEMGLGEYEFLLSKDCESLHFWVTIAPSWWIFERDPMSGFGALWVECIDLITLCVLNVST